ncbi:hypothetical protein D210916BOD24_17330 [Alteromonas sp. D210916BOD_24]|uniref:hypothetical protein n=1 Tax=Alteromonas sp. D210916BOD_24 TaxID=3157618 RepID=UPI00399C76B6
MRPITGLGEKSLRSVPSYKLLKSNHPKVKVQLHFDNSLPNAGFAAKSLESSLSELQSGSYVDKAKQVLANKEQYIDQHDIDNETLERFALFSHEFGKVESGRLLAIINKNPTLKAAFSEIQENKDLYLNDNATMSDF